VTKQEAEEIKTNKVRARAQIADFTVSIPYYLVNSRNIEDFEIDRYESLKIFKCNYDENRGITPRKELVEEVEINNWDKGF